jgi:hypothetical protein
MTQHYRKPNDDDDDLSGFLVSQPHQAKKVVEDSEDLSGFLSNQRRPQPVVTTAKTARQDEEEDLSGCLTSGFLKPKKTMPIASHDPVPTDRMNVNEIEIDEDPGSDWLYLN